MFVELWSRLERNVMNNNSNSTCQSHALSWKTSKLTNAYIFNLFKQSYSFNHAHRKIYSYRLPQFWKLSKHLKKACEQLDINEPDSSDLKLLLFTFQPFKRKKHQSFSRRIRIKVHIHEAYIFNLFKQIQIKKIQINK